MNDSRSRLYVTLAVIALVMVMFAGVVLIALLRPEAVATVISFVGSTLTTAIAAVLILIKVNKVERQTNGINTALMVKATGMTEEEIDGHKGVSSEKSART